MDPGAEWTIVWIFVILPIVLVIGFIGQLIDERIVRPRRKAKRHAEYMAYKQIIGRPEYGDDDA